MKQFFILFSILYLLSCFSFSQTSKIDSLKNLAGIYKSQNDYSASLKYYYEAKKIAEQTGNKTETGIILRIIGNLHFYQGDYSKSLEQTLAALKILEETGNKKEKALALDNIGTIYTEQGNYETALKYFQQSLAITEELKDTIGMGNNYHQIGNIYNYQYKPKEALEYYFKALRSREQIDSKNGIAASLIGIGNIFGYQANDSVALTYFTRALKITREINDKRLEVYVLNNISTVYFNQNNFLKALDYLWESLELAKQSGVKQVVMECYQFISLAYDSLHNYRKAYQYHILFSQMKDSIFNEESQKQITEMQTKYETEKKEQQIKLLNKDKEIQSKDLERQKTIRNAVAGGLLLVLFFSFVLINRLLLIRKQKKVIEIEREKSEKLLLNILPKEIAEELKINNSVTPQFYKLVTVMFTDFKGFTTIAEKMSAEELVSKLDFIFKKFDEIISKYPIEKIKTIGDAYMCAGGLPVANTTNPMDVVMAGLEICEFMKSRQVAAAVGSKEKGLPLPSAAANWQIRIGIHTGSVIAGVVGDKKFAYDIWGDTVNTASRMESSGEAGKVNISGSTYNLLRHSERSEESFQFTFRGKIPAKNKGEIEMYFVERSIV